MTTTFSAKWLNCSQSAGVMSEDKQAALDEFTKKNLLKVEKSNNPCTEVFLKELCGQDILSFGTEGSKLWRQVQLFGTM
jgi:hypothetical protein